jgi:hypothetical protein
MKGPYGADSMRRRSPAARERCATIRATWSERARVENGERQAVKRFGWWCVLVATAALSLSGAAPLRAASFTLTPIERAEAVRAGKRSIVSDELGAEWKVSGERAGQTLIVMTPFHRLALAARNAAFKSQELPPKEIDDLLRDHEGRLTLWAALEGGKADFARFYTPVLVSGRQEIKPSFRQNERTGRREDNGSYTARCVYVFPTAELKPNDTLVLIVRDSDDRQVAKFTLDLSAMR